MSRVREKELKWTAAAGADGYTIYGEASTAVDFAARADAGIAPKLGDVAASPFPLVGLADGVWQFAVVSHEVSGNTGDPALVVNVPLDQSPPPPATDLVVAYVV